MAPQVVRVVGKKVVIDEKKCWDGSWGREGGSKGGERDEKRGPYSE